MGPSPHLCFCAFTTATLWPELIVSMGPRPHISFCACKTTWLSSEILVSVGPSPHLWFVHAKQRLLEQNYKSLWVPALICGFCIQNSNCSTRIACLYGSLPSSVVFACKTAPFSSELQVYICPRLLLLICECKPVCFDPEWLLSIGPSLHLLFCAFKTAALASQLLFSMGPSPHLWRLHAKQRR